MLLANYNHARDVTLRCGYVEEYAETDVSSPSPRNMSFNFFFLFSFAMKRNETGYRLHNC